MFLFCSQYALSQPTSPANPFHIHTIMEGEGVGETPPPLPTRNSSNPSLPSKNSHHAHHRASLPPLPPRPSPVPSANHAAVNVDGGWSDSNFSDGGVSTYIMLSWLWKIKIGESSYMINNH